MEKVNYIMVHMEKWKKISADLKARGYIFVQKPYTPGKDLHFICYYWQEETCVRMAYKEPGKPRQTIQTHIDRCNDGESILGGKEAMRELSLMIGKHSGLPAETARALLHLHDDEIAPINVNQYNYCNRKREGVRYPYAVSYDMNSAFAWAMKKPMPDTTRPLGFGEVKPGMIGFMPSDYGNKDGKALPAACCKALVLEGWAPHRFPLIPSPFNYFVDFYYDRKKNATGMQRADAKRILVAAVGALQNHNAFLRVAIIEYCNRVIDHYVKKYRNSVLCAVTDSIISTERIPELDNLLGDEVGQWKIENEGDFAYIGWKQQWNFGTPETKVKFSGVPKSRYDFENFDILTSPLRESVCTYKLERGAQIVKVEEEEK